MKLLNRSGCNKRNQHLFAIFLSAYFRRRLAFPPRALAPAASGPTLDHGDRKHRASKGFPTAVLRQVKRAWGSGKPAQYPSTGICIEIDDARYMYDA